MEHQGDDLDEVRATMEDYQLQIAFINLKPDDSELDHIGESRHIYQHCHIRYEIKDNTLLSKYINDLHITEYDDQNQMPNPTVINTISSDG